MRSSILFLGLVCATALNAQITIGEDDMPSAGDTLRYRNGNPQGLDLDLTGAGVEWDFSALLPQAEGADTTVSVGSTPLLYQFFFNNPFLYPQHRADYGMRGVEFDFQMLTLSEVYDYYRADDEGFFNVGFGANVNGLPTSVRRMPVDRIHSFPMNFGDTDSSSSSFNVSVPTLLYFGQDQVRHNVVDGWGTLYLPADTFEVLRVKSTLQRTDTIFVEQFGFGFRLPEPETVEYKWIAVGMAKPVLEVVTTAGMPISVEFFYEPEDITTGMAALDRNQLTVYPNPSAGEFAILVPADMGGILTIHDVAGRAVRSFRVVGGAVVQADLRDLAEGSYRITLHGQKTTLQHAVVVQR